MQTKHVITVVATFALALSLAGCGSSDGASSASSSTTMQAPASTSESAASSSSGDATTSSSGGATASSSSAASSSSTASTTSTPAAGATSSASSSSAEKALVEFGTADANGSTFVLTNNTGKAIRSLSARATGSADYLPSIIPDGSTLADGEEARINLPAVEPAASEETGIETRALADVQIVLDDDSTYEMHQINVTDVDNATVRIEESVGYLEYTSKSTSEAVSTLESEKSWIAAQQPAEEPAPAEPAYQEPVYEEPVYQEPAYQEPVYQEPVYEAPAVTYDNAAVGGGAEDGCVPDLVLR